jgi:CheY-like chemotaxis protein
LVVENEADVRDVLCLRFRGEGVGAECVSCCADALNLLKHREFAAVVLDLGMSPIDGQTCGSYIHTLYPLLPLVAFTGYPEAADEARLLKENGFVGRYVKGRDDDRMVEDVCRITRAA